MRFFKWPMFSFCVTSTLTLQWGILGFGIAMLVCQWQNGSLIFVALSFYYSYKLTWIFSVSHYLLVFEFLDHK